MTAGKVNARYLRMPHVESGMVVGLFGGSFNPPHQGHVLVADTTIQRLGLDQLWWMVTPGNPLKDHNDLAPLADRIAMSETIARNLGRSLQFEHVPVGALRDMQASRDPLQSTFGALGLAYAYGDPIPDAAATAAKHGIRLSSVADYAATLRA